MKLSCESFHVEAFDSSISSYLPYDFTRYVPPPSPSLNGGLYTGEPFKTNAPYRNFPNKADGVFLKTHALASAHPPPGASSQFSASELLRPGNNVADTMPTGLENLNYNNNKCDAYLTCTKHVTSQLSTQQRSYSKLHFE
jgi:hypothetical protein